MFAKTNLFNKKTFSPDLIDLSGENVHIWRASLTRPQEMHSKLLQLLSDDEYKRAKRFYFERHQHSRTTCQFLPAPTGRDTVNTTFRPNRWMKSVSRPIPARKWSRFSVGMFWMLIARVEKLL